MRGEVPLAAVPQLAPALGHPAALVEAHGRGGLRSPGCLSPVAAVVEGPPLVTGYTRCPGLS